MENNDTAPVSRELLNDGRRTTFGLAARCPFLWLASLLLAAGAALIVIYFACGGSAGACLGGWRIPLLVILPAAAAVIFIAEAFIHGRDRLYKTGFAVLLGTVYFIFRVICVYREENGYITKGLLLAGLIVWCVLCLVVWELTSNAMRIKSRWPAFIAFMLPVLLHVIYIERPLFAGGVNPAAYLWHLGSMLLLLGMAAACLGLKKFTAELYRPRRGDRPDGRLLRGLDPMNGVAIYIMPTRNGASTYYRNSFDCAKAEEYIRRKREEGLTSFGMMHLIAAAYIRVIASKPGINRFISGQRVFTRDNEVELSMVVKKDLTAEAPETVIKVVFDRGDSVEEVYRKYQAEVSAAKQTPLDSGFDNLAWLINAVPGILKKFLVWFLKFLDYFGFLPRFLMRLSPFHGSVFITSLGSLGIQPVYHHLYDFGNIPLFIAFGARHTENEVNDSGEHVRTKYMDYTMVSDERICDGYYYSSAIKAFHRYMLNPDKLDLPLESVTADEY